MTARSKNRSALHAHALSAALIVALSSCRGEPATPDNGAPPASPLPEAAAPTPAGPRVESHWDPRTGKGDVTHTFANGDVMRTWFQCDDAGYTGGLVIGDLNTSGLVYHPREPIGGLAKIDVVRAQDESIFDRDEHTEYTYGWSENFGKGDDGKRLDYVRGRVLEAGPERVVLESENQGGCYTVRTIASSRAETRFWIVATRIVNRCDHPVHFDLFTGDARAKGDVGWTADGIVRRETALGAGLFTAGGLYDLGNGALGHADFFAIDPTASLPDIAAFANSFAHAERDVRPSRPLDQKAMVALNLGWKNRTLAPGEGFTTALAAGMAETSDADGGAAAVPRAAQITEDDWSVWRRHLEQGARGDVAKAPLLAAERVEITVGAREIEVVATFHLLNASGGATRELVDYPILTGPDRPAPREVLVNGQAYAVDASDKQPAVRFPVSFPDRGIVSFEVRYVQKHSGRRAGYLVTSALRWPGPIGRAVFVVRHPASLGNVRLSYPPDHVRRVAGAIHEVIVRQPFKPDRELEISW